LSDVLQQRSILRDFKRLFFLYKDFTMRIATHNVVTLDYIVTNADGDLIDTTEDSTPLVYLHGTNFLVAGLEAALEGHVAGDALTVTLEPADAYGEYDEQLVQTLPGELFDGMEVGEGDTLMADTDGGHIPVTVLEVAEDYVKIDANHPLAGMELTFAVQVREVRAATEEELAHGHVHQIGGCGSEGHGHGGACHAEHEAHDGCCGGHGKKDHDGCCGGHGQCQH
jgi:FKBP-type peptidyl-prolyl cis-trans isomerase SlyD